MYTVVGGARSRAFRVLWALEELGIAYEHLNEGPRSAKVLELNPSGKVPVLLDGDQVITDSTAILTYLADKHGSLTHPAGTIARARQDAHLHFVLDEMDSVLWTASKHSFALPETMRVPEIKPSLKEEWRQSVERLDQRLAGDFLAGDSLTVPDIVACHCLGWAVVAKFPMENERVKAWSKALRNRPAYQRAAVR